MVKDITGLDAFFAEGVQDLNGLDSNILGSLRDCAGFITVMHPRGRIVRPDGSMHVRASVWIEQEIAIATYIQRAERRDLPVIAFIHDSIGREGIRDLLHLNPISFTDDTEVLAALPERLLNWKALTAPGIGIQIRVEGTTWQDKHEIRALAVSIVNDTNQRITSFTCEARVPAGILSHWTAHYLGEVSECDAGFRCFRKDETQMGPIPPHSSKKVFGLDYCTTCAVEHTQDAPTVAALLVRESQISAKVWIENREYIASKTIKQLAEDRENAWYG
jgi:hypothetical protein